jgi:hypothetical protein
MMARWKRYPLRGRPVLAGLLWSAMFVAVFALIILAMGNPFEGKQPFLFLVLLAIPAGQLWSFSVKTVLDSHGEGE